MRKSLILSLTIIVSACNQNATKMDQTSEEGKIVVYQVMTRLFGNTNNTNKTWGTIEENGVGKFADFTDKALEELKALGITHIWFTGIPHHAVIRDYNEYGISDDDPDVVKGRAGSPYAVKDYYNVNPDLATDPANRLREFEDLINRTHRHGIKVIIDIVPNHIARRYEGLSNPDGVRDFGTEDDTSIEYRRDNNFYYIPGSEFKVPEDPNYKPLGGEAHPLADGMFEEIPAKWTGNGSRSPQPGINDWYETVKINFGVRPDGTKDFPTLPDGFENKGYEAHYEYWNDKDVPDSWIKFREIALYWTDKGIDGFRYDMAEMVPVEFWSYLNSHIKIKNPDAFLLAEIYNPAEYRNYIRLGKMDYLYDKVELYDTLKAIVQDRTSTVRISEIAERNRDIMGQMLNFLENHDEQRIATPEFAGNAENGKPLMVVSTCISTAPVMIYFGQEAGEKAEENAGFGTRSRTSIFDYIGVPAHQRWMNEGKFDGGQLSAEERQLRDFYKRLLNFARSSAAIGKGEFYDLHHFNLESASAYDPGLYSFSRWYGEEKLIIVSNFDKNATKQFELMLPEELISKWNLRDGSHKMKDVLYSNEYDLKITNGIGRIKTELKPNESFILKLWQ